MALNRLQHPKFILTLEELFRRCTFRQPELLSRKLLKALSPEPYTTLRLTNPDPAEPRNNLPGSLQSIRPGRLLLLSLPPG